MWEAWKSGDRKAAVEAIGDDVVDELVVHGSPQQCKDHIQAYVDNGVTVPVVMPLPFGLKTMDAVRLLAPAEDLARRASPAVSDGGL